MREKIIRDYLRVQQMSLLGNKFKGYFKNHSKNHSELDFEKGMARVVRRVHWDYKKTKEYKALKTKMVGGAGLEPTTSTL